MPRNLIETARKQREDQRIKSAQSSTEATQLAKEIFEHNDRFAEEIVNGFGQAGIIEAMQMVVQEDLHDQHPSIQFRIHTSPRLVFAGKPDMWHKEEFEQTHGRSIDYYYPRLSYSYNLNPIKALREHLHSRSIHSHQENKFVLSELRFLWSALKDPESYPITEPSPNTTETHTLQSIVVLFGANETLSFSSANGIKVLTKPEWEGNTSLLSLCLQDSLDNPMTHYWDFANEWVPEEKGSDEIFTATQNSGFGGSQRYPYTIPDHWRWGHARERQIGFQEATNFLNSPEAQNL